VTAQPPLPVTSGGIDVEKIGLLLNNTARTWRTKLDQRLKPLGLSQGKWTTLAHLAKAEAALKRIKASPGLSRDVADIVERALDAS